MRRIIELIKLVVLMVPYVIWDMVTGRDFNTGNKKR